MPRLTDQGLLIEESRTNYITHSTDFTEANGDWSYVNNATGGVTNPTVTANQGVAPDGTNTASRFQANAGTVGAGGESKLHCNRDGGGRKNCSIWMKSNTNANQTIYFQRVANEGGPTVNRFVVTTEWQRILGFTNDWRFGAIDISDQSLDILLWAHRSKREYCLLHFYTQPAAQK